MLVNKDGTAYHGDIGERSVDVGKVYVYYRRRAEVSATGVIFAKEKANMEEYLLFMLHIESHTNDALPPSPPLEDNHPDMGPPTPPPFAKETQYLGKKHP